jgi:formylglycine-generating enzyme required for sulfatase activity
MSWFGAGDVLEPKMVRIRPSVLLMGSPPEEQRAIEQPQHRVRIGYPFEVGKYPVTFREWDSVAKPDPEGDHQPSDEGWGRGRRPVIDVSWNDAQIYIKRLNGATGKAYRLLSEAEWEYCCRAGTQTAYSFGPTISRRQANFKNSQSLPVDRFPANRFGLVGMHGNVWELCEDCWNDNYSGAPADGSPWRTGSCLHAVLRGGSWYGHPEGLRSALRTSFVRTNRSSVVGFRLARTLTRVLTT